MKKLMINLKEAKTRNLEGRQMFMLVTPETIEVENISMVLIRVNPGQTVRPCHSHSKSEEIIYITKGKGEAWIEEEIISFKTNSAIFFPRGYKHMIRNTGESILEALCVFSPPELPESYEVYNNIEFKKDK